MDSPTTNGNAISCYTKNTPADFWVSPAITGEKYRTGLFVNNSLAGGKVEFIPLREGKLITWYGCGPTVYDAAHLGHARTYVAFDIIRRIMTEYFGYNIFMCMNITDIDDKIIKRSNEKNVDFATLARYWEGMFWEDMEALNVQLPDVITRVSEYVPNVVQFIQGIIDNNYGYESHGSVYFDTQAFRASSRHVYGRMEPSSVNDQARVLEGEGELSIVTQKKSPLDFALWKKSKEGEPSWDSPWGKGRPGWHIECSTMACDVLGFPVDIHSGGIDLRFPHHDNEMAQSEAKYDQPQWVNYFLHAGHLHIKGSKMSKSLKNFVSIKECLSLFSARAIRLLTLMHRWDAPMNYSVDGDSMSQASEADKHFINFFGVTQSYLRTSAQQLNDCSQLETAKCLNDLELRGVLAGQAWDKNDILIHETICNKQQQVDSALRDNFDTPTCITLLRSLVTDLHIYLKQSKECIKMPLIIKGARFIFRILKIFGLTNGNETDLNYIGTNDDSKTETSIIECLSTFRGQVRDISQELFKNLRELEKSKESVTQNSRVMTLVQDLLKRCDTIRDNVLPELGIQIEDMPTGPIWKKSTRDELLREKERKLAEEKKKQLQKEETLRLQKELKLQKEALLQISPTSFFSLTKGDLYSEYDDSGLPIKNNDGSAVSKAQRDKLRKILDKHTIAHTTWANSQQV